MEIRVKELSRLLPYIVRDKMNYHLDYVNDRLIDIALEEGVYHRLREIRDQVELIFFVRLLYGYFVIGFQNYERMLAYFDSKGVQGFQIGSTAFTRQSPITRQWHEIAEELADYVREGGWSSFVAPGIPDIVVIRRIIDSLLNREKDESRERG